MPSDQETNPEKLYEGVKAKADPFFIRSSSLLPQLMLLHIDDYNLAVAPAYFSFDEISLLLVLSSKELALFSRYVNGTCSLALALDPPGAKEAVRFVLWAALSSLEPLKDRMNACMATLKLKTRPPLYVEILSTFFGELEARRQKRELLADRWFEPKDDKGPAIAAELAVDQRRIPVAVQSLGTKQARVTLPESVSIAEGGSLALRISKGPLAFSVAVSQPAERALPSGEIVLDLGFSNELVSLIEESLSKLPASKTGR